MTAGSIFLGIALLIAVVTYLTYPFWGAQEQERRTRRSNLDLLTDQKEAILAQIRVLDFDFETGKLPEEAHTPQRAQLLAEATAVLQELDTLTGTGSDDALEAAISRARKKSAAPAEAPKPAAVGKDDLDNTIEAAIARARKKDTVPAEAPKPAPVPVETTTPASANGRARFCPQCGSTVQSGDKFCAACGHNLITKATK